MLTLLLADDHAIVRRGLRGVLGQQPDLVVIGEAGDGEEAVRMTADMTPDIAILDITMPKLNGLEAARRIRQVSPGTQVLVFTQVDSAVFVRQMVEAGVRGYLLKSDAETQLVAAIRALAQGQPYFNPAVTETILREYLGANDIVEASEPSLTPRELDVVRAIAEGCSGKQIAQRLGISAKTVETHRTALMRKIGAHGVADVVRFAAKHGLMPL